MLDECQASERHKACDGAQESTRLVWLEEAKQTSEKDTLGVSLAQRECGERARGHSSGENGQYKGSGSFRTARGTPRLERNDSS